MSLLLKESRITSEFIIVKSQMWLERYAYVLCHVIEMCMTVCIIIYLNGKFMDILHLFGSDMILKDA